MICLSLRTLRPFFIILISYLFSKGEKMIQSAAVEKESRLNGNCLTPNLAKNFFERKNSFSKKDIAHIEECAICQQAIKKTKEDMAWHGR